MTQKRRVIMLGLDATDSELINTLCDAGRLPALSALRARGRRAELDCAPSAFLSMVWPNFNSSTPVSHHGWYLNKVWRHERMRVEYAKPSWLPQTAFWDALDPAQYKVALLDVPFSMGPPKGMNGIYLNGWQNHDDFGRITHPRNLWRELESEFGRPAMNPELFGPQSPDTLLALREEMLAAAEQFAELSASTLRDGDFDLFVSVFGAAHRCGHYLWSLREIDTHGLTRETLRLLESALQDVYIACDRGLSKVLQHAGDDATVVVFALHGMGANSGWFEHFHTMVSRIQSGGVSAPPKQGLLFRAKKALPWTLVRQVTTRLPSVVNQALVPIWSSRMHDWAKTPYFVLPADLNGYLRINLRGREPQGIVEPGQEMDELCEFLTRALTSFKDTRTGEPVVACVERVRDMPYADAPRLAHLPDLVVQWNTQAASESTGMRSAEFGEITWERGTKLPSGRSGNHRGPGWMVSAGPGISASASVDRYDIIDLGPTVLRWLDADIPPAMVGTPIESLL